MAGEARLARADGATHNEVRLGSLWRERKRTKAGKQYSVYAVAVFDDDLESQRPLDSTQRCRPDLEEQVLWYSESETDDRANQGELPRLAHKAHPFHDMAGEALHRSDGTHVHQFRVV